MTNNNSLSSSTYEVIKRRTVKSGYVLYRDIFDKQSRKVLTSTAVFVPQGIEEQFEIIEKLLGGDLNEKQTMECS